MNPKMIEIAEKKLIEKWKYTYDHYTKQECPPECPCRNSTFDDDEPNFFFGMILKITHIFVFYLMK